MNFLMERAFMETIGKSSDHVIIFGNKLITVDYATIYADYAKAIGKPELTTMEKQQAILNAILDGAK